MKAEIRVTKKVWTHIMPGQNISINVPNFLRAPQKKTTIFKSFRTDDVCRLHSELSELQAQDPERLKFQRSRV